MGITSLCRKLVQGHTAPYLIKGQPGSLMYQGENTYHIKMDTFNSMSIVGCNESSSVSRRNLSPSVPRLFAQ